MQFLILLNAMLDAVHEVTLGFFIRSFILLLSTSIAIEFLAFLLFCWGQFERGFYEHADWVIVS